MMGFTVNMKDGYARLQETCDKCGEGAGYSTFGAKAFSGWTQEGRKPEEISAWFGYIGKRDYSRLHRALDGESGICSKCYRKTSTASEQGTEPF